MKRLMFWLAVVGVAYALFWLHHTTRDDPMDLFIIAEVAAAFGLAALVQLLWTRDWPMRVVGVLFTAIATAVFYAALTYTRISDQPRDTEWLVDIARAFYVVGGPLFAVGMILWVRDNWREPPTFPEVERRSGGDRRKSTADIYGRTPGDSQ